MPAPGTVSSGTTTSYRVPECLDCAALPPEPRLGDLDGTVIHGPYRPRAPRPVYRESGPRSPRCYTHWQRHVKAARQRASDARSRKRSGVDEPTRQAVLTEQGHRCAACNRNPNRLNLDADHDHDTAAEHEHAEDVACLDCLRGYLCRSCNRDILGRLRGRLGSDEAVIEVLTSLVAYLTHSPAARVRARRALALFEETA